MRADVALGRVRGRFRLRIMLSVRGGQAVNLQKKEKIWKSGTEVRGQGVVGSNPAAGDGGVTNRSWGWLPSEHLVMAAFVFPLVVKMSLVQEGRYALSRADEIRCRAVDALLTRAGWATENGSSINTIWQGILNEQRRAIRVADAVRKAVADLQTSKEMWSINPDAPSKP